DECAHQIAAHRQQIGAGERGRSEIAALCALVDLVVDPADLGDHVRVDRVAQGLLRPEVMAYEPRRDPGRRRDAPDRGPCVAMLGELQQCRLTDAGPGREIFERGACRPRGRAGHLTGLAGLVAGGRFGNALFLCPYGLWLTFRGPYRWG